LFILEAEDAVAVVDELRGTDCIVFGGFIVNTAVQFDHKAVLGAEEISDIWAKRVLALEFQPIQPPVAQCLPQEYFCRGQFMP